MNISGDGDINCVDLERINKRLNIRAYVIARYMPDQFNVGISPEDVVGEVWLEFLGSQNRLGWNRDWGREKELSRPDALQIEESLERFLSTVLRRRIIDHIRRNGRGNKYFTASADDQKFVPYGSVDPALFSIEFENLVERLKAEAAGDEEIERLIAGALKITEDGKVDQQLAEILGTSPRRIVNIRKRFRRMLVAKERWEWWTKAISTTRTGAERPAKKNSDG